MVRRMLVVDWVVLSRLVLVGVDVVRLVLLLVRRVVFCVIVSLGLIFVCGVVVVSRRL